MMSHWHWQEFFAGLFGPPEAKGGGINLRGFPNLGRLILIPDSLRSGKTNGRLLNLSRL
jgi:hypothetical protein